MLRTPARRAAGPGLPVYALYGETEATQGLDGLHVETIADRSAHHDWEIRPHRHAGLVQFLYMAAGRGEAWAEGSSHALRGPCVVVMPPWAVHGFRFSPTVQGHVVTVAEAHARAALAGDAALARRAFALRVTRLGGARSTSVAVIAQAMRTLQDEYVRREPWRELALDAALRQLLLAVARLADVPASAGEGGGDGSGQRARWHAERSLALVERRFREQPSMAAFAQALAITPTQLNRVCRQVFGRGALDVLHARLALEARRELAYTAMSVKQVAGGLGFADAAYFTRFFRRAVGAAPSEWRAARGR